MSLFGTSLGTRPATVSCRRRYAERPKKPASFWGEVRPAKREMAPPWEKPPIGGEDVSKLRAAAVDKRWNGYVIERSQKIPRTMREAGMPFSASAATREVK